MERENRINWVKKIKSMGVGKFVRNEKRGKTDLGHLVQTLI